MVEVIFDTGRMLLSLGYKAGSPIAHPCLASPTMLSLEPACVIALDSDAVGPSGNLSGPGMFEARGAAGICNLNYSAPHARNKSEISLDGKFGEDRLSHTHCYQCWIPSEIFYDVFLLKE